MSGIQLNVPMADYPTCSEYYVSGEIGAWFLQHLKKIPAYCGSNSWGTGWDDAGKSTVVHSYIVRDITPEDALMVKIQFPKCKIHVFE